MAERHKVVTKDEWLDARLKLLAEEKEFTHLRERLAERRRELPWEAVEKTYVFEGAAGKKTLPELFDGRRQLVVYHFMLGPDWEAGCPHCSFLADNFDPVVVHLNHRDVTMVAVSRAPYAKLAAYKKRMGWSFDWFSSAGSDFNFDYQASFRPEDIAKKKIFYNYAIQDAGPSEREGVSVFYKDSAGRLFHTYSAHARGIDMMNTAYQYLDIVPKGRDEAGHEFPQFWVKRRDEYGR